MMFPTQMPPVDKLLGGRDSAGKRYGFTTYDEVSISPTFYKQLFVQNCSAQLFMCPVWVCNFLAKGIMKWQGCKSCVIHFCAKKN